MCTGSEVFVISGRRFGRQPLEKQQIEFRCRPDEARQQGADLAAVVGLVVETNAPGPFREISCRLGVNRLGNQLETERTDHLSNSIEFGLGRATQRFVQAFS
jgi:hypothetical protein